MSDRDGAISEGTVDMNLSERQRRVLEFFEARTRPDAEPQDRPWFTGREVFDALGGGRSKSGVESVLRDLARMRVLQQGRPAQPGPYAEHPYRLRTVAENLIDLAKLAEGTRVLEQAREAEIERRGLARPSQVEEAGHDAGVGMKP